MRDGVNALNSENNNGQEQKIFVEQIRILYRTLLPILIVNLAVSFALTFGLWEVAPQQALTIWMGLMLTIFFARFFTYLIYRHNFKPEHAQRYARYFVIGTGITGLMWGIGGAILFPEQELEYQLLILFVLVGMGAGAVSSLTTYLPAFLAYFPVTMIPILIKLIMVGEPIQISLGVMSAAYIIALSYFGININRTLKESLKLRFENIDLVEQLREQKDEAEQANISKSKFLAAASHDLRQPLHALMLFTSVLDESIKYPEVRKVVDQIKASTQALQSLFNALLDISRLEAGVMKVEMKSFDIQALFEKLANDFNAQAREKGLHLSWGNCPFAVYSDPTLLEQILRNYLSNAIRYTDTGNIRIECDGENDLIHIHVIDTGVGIPQEELSAIFEEFHQLSNPERDRSKGLGLGLAIVHRTAKLLDHPISVDSIPGQGSRFSITVKQANINEVSALGPAPVEQSQDPGREKLIVIIDDEISVLEGTQSLLQIWGCDVITATNQEEALEKLENQGRSPDAIVADYRLREQRTGIEAIHAIHAAYDPEIPALIVTGDIAVDRLREVNDSGFQVLHKPIAPLKLRTFLRHIH
jgi:signal transduction histidine kinase